MEHPSNPWHISRTVWMNGTGPQPLPGELFQHGISRGHFDGDDLVIVSDRFTFDPDGMDDHLRMATSVRKKITERYSLIDDENLRLIITLEDPTFLTRPYTWAFVFAKTGEAGPRQRWVNCDAESARREQQYAYPGDKYPDGRRIRRNTDDALLVRFVVLLLWQARWSTAVNAQPAAVPSI